MIPIRESEDDLRWHGEVLTTGTYTTEEESGAALDNVLTACKLWIVYREVPGVLMQPRPAQQDKTVRIDRLLIPAIPLLSHGWTHGVIGVEVKRSGLKVGPALAQAMDYSRAVFTVDQLGGVRVCPDWTFIWPMEQQGGTLASIFAHNRIGTAISSRWVLLQLATSQNLLRVKYDGQVIIGPAPQTGRKAGSR